MADLLSSRPMLEPALSAGYEPYLVMPRAFTSAQCDRIMGLADDLGLSAAGLQNHVDAQNADAQNDDAQNAEAQNDAVRRAQVAWVPPSDDTSWIYERLGRLATKANRSYGFELSGFGEDLQLTAYDEADFYTWHIDGLDTGVAHRKLSIVVQLSDPGDYEGSLLEFLPVATDYTTEDLEAYVETVSARGTAIVFPSFEYHRVTPLVSGRRLSLVSWVSGPRFR